MRKEIVFCVCIYLYIYHLYYYINTVYCVVVVVAAFCCCCRDGSREKVPGYTKGASPLFFSILTLPCLWPAMYHAIDLYLAWEEPKLCGRLTHSHKIYKKRKSDNQKAMMPYRLKCRDSWLSVSLFLSNRLSLPDTTIPITSLHSSCISRLIESLQSLNVK